MAAGLALKERYGKVLIITYNKKDYRVEDLGKRGIRVVDPGEALRLVL